MNCKQEYDFPGRAGREHGHGAARLVAVLATSMLFMAMGCEKAGSGVDSPRPEPGAARPAPVDTGQTPAPAKAPARADQGPGFRFECFDMYPRCEPVVGVPALSADGKRVVVADRGPDTGRDELVLKMRVMDIDTGKVVRETTMIDYDDYERGIDPDSEEFTESFRAELEDRVRAFEKFLHEGGYRPLLALGRVHKDRAGDVVAGLRARFDGSQLVIEDESGKALWQRPIGPSEPFTRGDGEVCGPFPVADVSVWVSRAPRVAVALVTYIGSDLCATVYPYLVWR